MNEKVLKYLYDIKLAIDEINSFFENKQIVYEEYKNDLVLRRAIERNLEIIGEATNRIIKENPDLKLRMPVKLLV